MAEEETMNASLKIEQDYHVYFRRYAELLKLFLEQRFPEYDWSAVNIMAEDMNRKGLDVWQWDYVFLACDSCEGEDMEIPTWEEFAEEEMECDPADRKQIEEEWYRQLYALYESFRTDRSKEEVSLVCDVIRAMPRMIEIAFDWNWKQNEELIGFVERLEELTAEKCM